MLSLVIRIVVLSSEQDSWVSCRLDEINEEEIGFVRRDGELDEGIEEEEKEESKWKEILSHFRNFERWREK